jgi:putative tryptophan/tyrosine transport system substrate-binding protein
MSRQSRRRFLQRNLGLVGLGLLAGCSGVSSQLRPPAKIPRIGYLGLGTSGPNVRLEAFQQGMRDLGYAEGQNIVVEYRLAEGRSDELPGFAAELVRLGVDVLCTSSTTAAVVAKQATDTIPIVITAIGDPVALGIVASLSRPGGNVTGVTNLAPELSGKRLELLRDTLGGLSRVAILANAAVAHKAIDWRETERAAQALGLQLQALQVRAADEFEGAFAAMVKERAEALYVLEDALLYSLAATGPIVALAAQYRLPAMYALPEMVETGGLMAYGPTFVDAHRRAAAYVDKLLKGASPAELPVEEPTRFDFVINLKTAQSLGLTIPSSVLQQATEIIQ